MIPLQDELVRELKQTLNSIKLEEKGVYVQASTLGSLEALLEFLRVSKVPVSITHIHTHTVSNYNIVLRNCAVMFMFFRLLHSTLASTSVQSTRKT